MPPVFIYSLQYSADAIALASDSCPMLERTRAMVRRELENEERAMPDLHQGLDDDIGDEILRLVFTMAPDCPPRDSTNPPG
jgi:predicted RNA polymerase sigma factor